MAEAIKNQEKEVKEKIHKRIYSKTKNAAFKFKNEFQKHTVTAITAAFAFLIALSWRTPIQNTVNKIIEKLGLIGKEIYLEYASALIITLIAVLVLIFLSRWTSERD